MKSLTDHLIVSCDETEDTPETTSINRNDKTNYRLLTVILLAIACLLLLVAIVKYNMKRRLTIPCLLSYYCEHEYCKRNRRKRL